MQLPSKLYLGYRDYDILPMPEEDEGKNIGLHLPQKQLIHVDHSIKPNEVVNTFIHEVIHAIFSIAHFEFESDEMEESVVTCLGNGLTQFFRDNREVIEWIMENCQITNEKTSRAR